MKSGFVTGNCYASSSYKNEAASRRAQTEMAASERGVPPNLPRNLQQRQYAQHQSNQDTKTERSAHEVDDFLGKIYQQESVQDQKKSITVINQGQRDLEVVEAIGTFGDNQQLNSTRLIKFSESLTQETVSRYAIQNKSKLIEPLQLAQRSESLTKTQFQGIAFLSILIGERCWSSLPKMFELHQDKLHSLQMLRTSLDNHFDAELTNWILEYNSTLDMQAWQMIRHLCEKPLYQHQKHIMRLQSFVTLSIKEFGLFTEVCQVALQWMLTEENLTMRSLQAHPKQEKLSFKEFVSFCVEFAATHSSFRKEHEDTFVNIPIKHWVAKLQEIKSVAHVQDAHSVINYIQAFNKKYNEAVEAVDMRAKSTLIAGLLKDSANGPNNLQMALAQSSLGLFGKYPQQIHVIKGGQGKSRVAATLAFLALYTKVAQKVHLIFTNAVLMRKDQTDFSSLWTLSDFEDKVVYHESMGFTAEEGELIIFDEADEFIYNDPKAFLAFIGQRMCVCLTATSGGSDQEVAENSILKHIGLKLFENVLFTEQCQQSPQFQEIELDGNETIHQHLKRQAQQNAVLVYAHKGLKEHLEQNQFPFLDLDGDIDHSVLRKLDETVNGLFRVLVATNKSISMRGLDYRAPNNGIQLLICRSFSHQRESQQAAFRVGRQGDPCERLILKDLPLLDQQKIFNYKQKLFEFIKTTEQRLVIKFSKPVKGSTRKKPVKAPPTTVQEAATKLFSPWPKSQLSYKRIGNLLGQRANALPAKDGGTGAQQDLPKRQKVNDDSATGAFGEQ